MEKDELCHILPVIYDAAKDIYKLRTYKYLIKNYAIYKQFRSR